MRKSTRRKLKVYAVDAAMILLAAQVTVVLKADNKAEASTYTTIQAIQDEQAETGSDAETPENEVTGDASADDSFVVWGWNDDIKKILDGPFKEAYPDDYERIVFVNTAGSIHHAPEVRLLHRSYQSCFCWSDLRWHYPYQHS